MWVPLIRSVSRPNFPKHACTRRFGSVSSLAPLTSSDGSDSGSDETPISHARRSDHLDRPTVVETLDQLKRDPKLALSFISHLTESGFRHDIVTFMAVVRFLCYQGMDRRLASLFLEAIQGRNVGFGFGFELLDLIDELLEEIRAASAARSGRFLARAVDALVKALVSRGRLEEAFDAIKRGEFRVLPSTNTCNQLMNRLIRHGEVDMAMAVYSHLPRNGPGTGPNVYTYGIVIKGLCKTGRLREAVDVFTEMKEAGVEPDGFTFDTFIDGLCSNGYTDSGLQLLNDLRESGWPVGVFAYSCVIRGYVRESRLQDAENVLLNMLQAGIEPDVYCYSALIHGFCRNGDILKALAVHDEMGSRAVGTNCVVVSSVMQCLCRLGLPEEAVHHFTTAMESGISLDGISFHVAIDALCQLRRTDDAAALLAEMRLRKMNTDIKHYTALINGYCRQGDLRSAWDVFVAMNEDENRPKPDVVMLNVLVRRFSRNGLVDETFRVLDVFRALGLEPDCATYNLIVDGFCKAGKVKEARLFFDALEWKNPSNYVTMMNGYCDAGHTREAYGVFLRGPVTADASCYSKLLARLCEEDETDRALAVFETGLKLGHSPSEIIYGNLISACFRAGDVRTARWVFDTMIGPHVVTYTIMLHGYCRANLLTEAHGLFRDMKDRGIEPDIVTYTVLVDGETKARRRSLLGTGPSRYRAEMHGLVPDVVCYTVLIDGCCKSGRLEDAVRLFDEMVGAGLRPDTVTYTALMCGYWARGLVARAEMLYDVMLSNGVRPDSRTVGALQLVKARRGRFRWR